MNQQVISDFLTDSQTSLTLMQMLRDEDAAKSKRVMAAMMKMIKLDIALLTQAYEGG